MDERWDKRLDEKKKKQKRTEKKNHKLDNSHWEHFHKLEKGGTKKGKQHRQI